MKRVLIIVAVAQFLCTSLWFAGNAVVADLIEHLSLSPDFLAHITSTIQFGFICGTFIFAFLSISDRISPSLVFFTSSIFAAIFNVCVCLPEIQTSSLLIFRFLTGFFLAGIYPVGMKIMSDHFKEGLGKSLGFLVGALVLGTAFPHLIKHVNRHLNWEYVFYTTSLLSLLGGFTVYFFVKDGPHRRAASTINFSVFLSNFKNTSFRSAAFGYFGHMWELYTFWAFVPIILQTYNQNFPEVQLPVSLLSFLIIASGTLSCIASGIASQKIGEKKLAGILLFSSTICCLLSPLFVNHSQPVILILFLFIWGVVVIGDSPLFSTLVAKNASPENRGSSLTLVNCIGFSITIVSIQFLKEVVEVVDGRFVYLFLAPGPIFGLISLTKKRPINSSE